MTILLGHRTIVLATAVAASVCLPAAARAAVDRRTVPALAVANRFLNAWQMRAGTEGLALASPRLRQQMTDKGLRTEIFGLSNPHHLAYEVSDGRALGRGRFSVGVRLFEEYTGYERPGPRPPQGRMVLVRTETGEWKVDELPSSPNRSKRGSVLSSDYGSALAVADRFLNAWRIGVANNGLTLLSPGLLQRRSEPGMRGYLTGTFDHRHQAYEIHDGWLTRGRYNFGVRMYDIDSNKLIHSSWVQIVLAKSPNGSWKVDDLK